MKDLLNTLFTMVMGLGVLVAALLIVYGLSSYLPGRWKERGRIAVFLVPALCVILVGLMSAVTKSIPGLPASCGGAGDRIWLLERGICGVSPPATAPGFNSFLLIVVFIWASAGISTVILSAAIKGVPDPLIEAARVDGATNRQVFYKVTLPYIRATIITVATLTTIA